ncbi:MAG TPA: hypothetical protein VIW78_00535 [Burkholderiales bacterium]
MTDVVAEAGSGDGGAVAVEAPPLDGTVAEQPPHPTASIAKVKAAARLVVETKVRHCMVL